MRLTGSRAYYRLTPPRMPRGMVELIEGLTKEVLRHNPSDVYGFCAGHMQHLLEIRDGPTQKKSLTLEEKISKAQETIRQRAEKRRQEYDKSVLQQQQSQNETDETLNSNNEEVTPSLIETHVADAIKIPVRHEQELENSSEIEISHVLPSPNKTIQDQTQNEDIPKHEIVISDEIEPLTVDETINLDNISMNGNNVNELISQPTENDDALENILQEGNIHNKGSRNEEKQNIAEKNTDKKSTYEEKNYSVNNNQEPEMDKVQQNVEGHENSVNIDENKISETNINEESLLGNDIDITENTFDTISNNYKLDVSKYTTTEISQFSEDTNEQSLNDTSKLETVKLDTANSKNHDPNPINALQDSSQIIELKDDNDVSGCKTEEIQCSKEIDINNLLKNVDKVEQSELSDNSGQVAATEEKIDILDLGIPQAIHSEYIKNDNNHNATPTTEDTIKKIHINEVENETLTGDAIFSVEPLDVNDETKSVDISTPGDEEITVHNDFKQDNLNEPYMKYSSVTNTDLEDGSNNIDNLSTKVEDNTRNAMTNSVNEDIENIAPHSNTENENNGSTVDLETAAITIQKVFRSFLFKSRASTFDDTSNDGENFLNGEDTNKKEENEFPITSTNTLERRPHGITRMDTVLQTVNEEKSLSLSTDDSSTLSSAATVIQAHVRGFLVRNKLNSNKTLSTNSFPASNSNDPSLTSLENDVDQHKNKTVLNIHIVPEGGNFLSRDESLITSMELSLDGSPPSSINLHPLGYDKSERRKQLKREDAIQSISPPSNNSGKSGEEVDSVKDILVNDNNASVEQQLFKNNMSHSDVDIVHKEPAAASEKIAPVDMATTETVVTSTDVVSNSPGVDIETDIKERRNSLTKMSSDEMDVVTPLISNVDKNCSDSKLMHSGELHDLVLPTRVSRSDTTVVREFKSVLVGVLFALESFINLYVYLSICNTILL